MLKVSIIGFGRFGKVLAQILSQNFQVRVFDIKDKSDSAKKLGVEFTKSKEKIFQSETIFYAIPISKLESVIKEDREYINSSHTVLDTCSVKSYPEKIFNNLLQGSGANLILTHPVFGPDSIKSGLNGLSIALNNQNSNSKTYKFWKNQFKSLGLKTVEISPKRHDELAAFSQGITHLTGRVLQDMGIKSTPIDTKGFKHLLGIVEQTCNDNWKLFVDLQVYNPYTRDMVAELEKSLKGVSQNLFFEKSSSSSPIIGIQGGRGSFNEEAAREYTARKGIKNYKIEYLYSSENVLKNLYRGEINRGIFAVHNAIGGTVKETIFALSKYNCTIIDEFQIMVNHCLLIKSDKEIGQIKKIMSHPHALSQCKNTLPRKYPDKELISGEGVLIDQAKAAEQLSKGNLKSDIAVLAPKICAEIYDLKVADEGLQDLRQNYTSFMFVKK